MPSRPLRTLPGLRTNDAMAGLLAHQSTLPAAFPERLLQWHSGHQLLADSCGYSAGFTPASLLSRQLSRHHLGRFMLQTRTSVNLVRVLLQHEKNPKTCDVRPGRRSYRSPYVRSGVQENPNNPVLPPPLSSEHQTSAECDL